MHSPATHPIRPPASNAGFSLVELLVIISVVGVMMAMVVPRIDTARIRVETELQNVSLTLNSAQRLAVLNQHDIVVAFDVDGARLRIHRDEDNDGVVDSGESARWVELEGGVTFGRAGASPLLSGHGDAVTFVGTQDALPAVTFRRNGSASEFGALHLTAGGAGSQGLGPEYTRGIEVERSTGQVTCMTYETLHWEVGC
jgi:Tfp pilus assembly protein FimT